MYKDKIKVIGTSSNKDHVFKLACDEFYIEPSMTEDAYAEWALDFCKSHGVDIFFVKKNRSAVVKRIKDFEGAGIVVVADEYNIQDIFNSKSSTYKYLEDNRANVKMPEYIIAKSIEEFKDSIEKFRKSGEDKICYKFDSDEGGGSFRVIALNKNNETAMGYPTPYQNLDKCLEELSGLQKSKGFKTLIVMPYMNGPEISIDCYNSKNGFVCVPRVKESSRVETIKNIPELEEYCENIQKAVGFKFPWNCQFRRDRVTGEYKLLEINTRLSGCSHFGVDAGCWIGEYLIKDLLNEGYEKHSLNETKIVKIEGHLKMK